jgi:ABC-type amino acid transport substrate-binding protein
VEELNAALAELKASGKYDELVYKWFVEFEG